MVLLSALLGLSEPCSSRQAARLLRCIHSTSVCHLTSENGSQVAQLEEVGAVKYGEVEETDGESYSPWLIYPRALIHTSTCPMRIGELIGQLESLVS